MIDNFLKLSGNESHSSQDLTVHKRRKAATLIEDDVSFSLSSDNEFFDAVATDEKYEKQKESNKQKAKCSKKSSKKQKKTKANIALSDNEGGESEEGEEDEKNIAPDKLPNKGANIENEEDEDDLPFSLSGEEEEEKKNDTLKAESFTGPFDPNRTGVIRSKNTVYNKSHLTGW